MRNRVSNLAQRDGRLAALRQWRRRQPPRPAPCRKAPEVLPGRCLPCRASRAGGGGRNSWHKSRRISPQIFPIGSLMNMFITYGQKPKTSKNMKRQEFDRREETCCSKKYVCIFRLLLVAKENVLSSSFQHLRSIPVGIRNLHLKSHSSNAKTCYMQTVPSLLTHPSLAMRKTTLTD